LTGKYRVILTPRAKKQLDKLDSSVSARIFSWLKNTLDNSEDPYSLGRKLAGGLSGMIRYRIGDHRIIAEIHDNELIILVIEVDHRRRVYD